MGMSVQGHWPDNTAKIPIKITDYPILFLLHAKGMAHNKEGTNICMGFTWKQSWGIGYQGVMYACIPTFVIGLREYGF